MTATKNITNLPNQAVEAINTFLNNTPFTPLDKNTFELFETKNPQIQQLIEASRFVRGQVIKPRNCYVNLDGVDYDEMVDEYTKTLNPSDYTSADYQKLIKDYRKECKAKMIHFGVVLRTTKFSDVDLLLLNEKYQPIGLRTEHFHS